MLSEIPLDVGAFIAGYLTYPDDINALRLTSKRCLRYAQEGVTHIYSYSPQSLRLRYMKTSYVHLFKNLSDVEYVITIRTQNELVLMASQPLRNAIFFLVYSSSSMNEYCETTISFIDLLEKSTSFNRRGSISIGSPARCILIDSTSIKLTSDCPGLVEPLIQRFPRHHIKMLVRPNVTVSGLLQKALNKCHTLLISPPINPNTIGEIVDSFVATPCSDKSIKVLLGSKPKHCVTHCITFLAMVREAYPQVSRTCIPVVPSCVNEIFRVFPNVTEIALWIEDEYAEAACKVICRQYPRLETIIVYRPSTPGSRKTYTREKLIAQPRRDDFNTKDELLRR